MNYFTMETERCRLRRFELTDIDSWVSFFEEQDAMRYFPPMDPALSARELAEMWVRRQLGRYAEGSYGHLAIIDKQTDFFAGSAGITVQTVHSKSIYEIGYSLKPEYRGRGIAIEVARKFMEYAMESKLADKMYSLIAMGNSASERVARKNGMSVEGSADFRGMAVNIWSRAIAFD